MLTLKKASGVNSLVILVLIRCNVIVIGNVSEDLVFFHILDVGRAFLQNRLRYNIFLRPVFDLHLFLFLRL